MFLKISKKKYKDKVYKYASIVESVRKDGKSTHRVVQNIGRIKTEEDLERAKRIEEAYKKGEKIVKLGDLSIPQTREYGLLWAADELWRKHGVHDALRDSLSGRKTEFDIERIIFLLTVNRLYNPGSDLSALEWIEEMAFPREDVEKQWVYRSLDKLIEEKDSIEENLLENLKESLDLSLDMVFYDLTSTFFEGEGPELADFGYSRDHRGDKEQIVLGVVMADGIPVAHKVWSGNTADVSTLKTTVDDLKERFGIENVVFVADRGVISSDNLEDLEEMGYDYIFSTKRRRENLVEDLLTEEVEGDGKVVTEEVHSENGKKYVVCLNRERRKDQLDNLDNIRKECEEKLEELKKKADKGGIQPSKLEKKIENKLGKNKRLFNHNSEDGFSYSIDKERWDYERAIAGKFLLVTTTDLNSWNVMVAYKNLKDVERAFDELKNLLKLRPIFHRTDKRVKAHVFVCYLALLTKRLITEGSHSNKRLKELKSLKVHELNTDNETMWMRNETSHEQQEILESLDLQKPPKITPEIPA
ncbi:hypothetical protein AKJ41_01720 [candidate division MSBL1 archaeon SCGC-AAA259O05]|uniref:Transposase IS4-like domain-containing protein n=1 Tax=candidate division MSBL1 archaeon SCGC-AAA259O05 TaxID=1698271 RepID=A0A133V4P3_9EURY|nr:hypothetical protein AKJ41_01720 [candidate division MSBL1 archaeon SCGC-AAA259O05]